MVPFGLVGSDVLEDEVIDGQEQDGKDGRCPDGSGGGADVLVEFGGKDDDVGSDWKEVKEGQVFDVDSEAVCQEEKECVEDGEGCKPSQREANGLLPGFLAKSQGTGEADACEAHAEDGEGPFSEEDQGQDPAVIDWNASKA